MEITIVSADSRMKPMVEMTLLASPIKVPMKVTIIKMEGTIGTSGPEESPIECLFSETVLSLLAPDIFNLFPKEKPVEVLIHYLNGFIERTFELSFEMTRHRTEVEMLKVTKDSTSKGAREAFAKIKAIEKRTQDAKMVLVKSIEENSHLLGVNEALTLEMKALKAWLIEAKVFEEEAQATLKNAEERMASLQGDMGLQIKVAAVRVVEKFRALKEYEDEQDRFAVNAYDKERHSIRHEVAFYYPRLNLDFFDEDLEAIDTDVAGVRSDPKDVP
ncbi:hypothetical protein COCNU_02G006410 [Cocos nucifera]|uniref:Uncharacterized protein n=1 Tax=Cocos nucifera TaxID=13894 RepID=A0A8K0HZH9_COCNU|nr:hypothetical protein COCNU_02G006410 [Cocos nucifera]